MWTVIDRWNNEILLTEERWQHIIEGHWELANLLEQVMEQNLKLLYDQEADALYVSQGRPEYTDYVELDENVILRLDPTTKEIVGFTIINFAALFSQREPTLSLPIDVAFRPNKEIGWALAG